MVFRDDFDGSRVNEEIWEIGTWSEHGGRLGRERVLVKDGLLNMLLINENNTIKSSAIQSRQTFLYGKWETRLKVSSVSGVLNSFYTIDWGGGAGTRQEVDIEFLTFYFGEQTGEVHFAVHAAGFDSFDTNPDLKLDFNPADDFHVWGLDITPEHIEWSVDGKSLLLYNYDEHKVKIDKPYMLKLNTRSQESWIKGPSEPGVVSTYLIDWIQFTPYE
ncbi:Beta-glucanase [bioreactor metagenome]|uniref:Beta-glucanase n=1 Tax=bioreactor metagenome TaxID=1076179 RepID=A0A645GZC5_9ZZZZ